MLIGLVRPLSSIDCPQLTTKMSAALVSCPRRIQQTANGNGNGNGNKLEQKNYKKVHKFLIKFVISTAGGGVCTGSKNFISIQPGNSSYYPVQPQSLPSALCPPFPAHAGCQLVPALIVYHNLSFC